MTEDILSRASDLRVVVRTGVGYDSVDVAAAARLGISVSNLPGINANAVAEYTFGLLLAAARRLVQVATGVSDGRWPREDGHELRGSTLGLIGYGAAARRRRTTGARFRDEGAVHDGGAGVGPSRRGPCASWSSTSCWPSPTTSRSTRP